MLASDAPDPRDVFWSNVGVDIKLMENRKIIVQIVLLIGLLGWGAIVTLIQNWTLMTLEVVPLGLSRSFVQGKLVLDGKSIIVAGC